jgi:hypothetical protein
MDVVECVMLMNYLLKLYDVILFVFVFLAVIILVTRFVSPCKTYTQITSFGPLMDRHIGL